MHSKQNITNDNNSSDDSKYLERIENNEELPPHPMKWNIKWIEASVIILLHIGAIYGFYLLVTVAKWQTWLCLILTQIATTVSITAGVHRLWAHKSYKAKLPLRIILATVFTLAYQYSCITWVRYHRLHHKYSDTDADPHNSKRGLFFSQIGWVLIKKHPQVKAQTVDVSDLMEDPLLRFQHKYYYPMVVLIGVIAPTYIHTLWGEKAKVAFYICVCLRFLISVHVTALVNSVAHKWGNKPYDKHIAPIESKIISFLTTGEGFHNYHHTFPWDYRTAELGGYTLNLTKLFIDFMAKIGWAYDLKIVPDELIKRRVKRTGDGTHPVWGWDDPDLSADDKKSAMVHHYRKKTDKSYTMAELQQAVQDVKNKVMTSYQAEEIYGIPRSTIVTRVYNNHMNDNVGRPIALGEDVERRIAHSLHVMEKHGFPLTRKEVAVLVSQYVWFRFLPFGYGTIKRQMNLGPKL